MAVSESVVNDYYQKILFREASASERAIWANLDTSAVVVAGIEHSPEALTIVNPLIRLYQGAFDRAPEVGGLSGNVDAMRDGHLSIFDMANAFANSAEFVSTYGVLTTEQYIEQLYYNVLNRVASEAEVEAWLSTGLDRAHILVGFTESAEFIANSASGVQQYVDNLAAGQTPAGGPLAGPTLSQVEHNPDATLNALGHSQAHPGTMLSGNGIPVEHGAAAIDHTTGTELWFRPDYRTSATSFERTDVDADGTVHYQGLAGAQDGSNGEQGINAGRGHLALNFAAISGVDGFENNDVRLYLDTDPTVGTHFNELHLRVIEGHQVWTTPNGVVVIGDDPQNYPNSVAENTANMMFGYWLGNADNDGNGVPDAPEAGQYDVIMTATPLVGQTLMNHIVIELV